MHHKVLISIADHAALKLHAAQNGERFCDAQNRAIERLLQACQNSRSIVREKIQSASRDSRVWQGWYVEPVTWQQFTQLRRDTGWTTGDLLHAAVRIELGAGEARAEVADVLVAV